MMEATAMEAKTKKETSILNIEEKVKLLEARKSLKENGHSQADIDELLPLPK